MIKLNENKRIFVLKNQWIELVLYVNTASVVETVYFGQSLENKINVDAIRRSTFGHWPSQYFDNKNKAECLSEDDYNFAYARKEISSNALEDGRGAPIIIEQEDGTNETEFLYKGYEIFNGYPSFSYPHAHGQDAETLVLFYQDEKSKIELKEYISISSSSGIIVKNFELINNTDKAYKIKKAMSMQLDLDSNKYALHHFGGRWGDERNEKTNNLVDGKQEISSISGRSSHEENPFMFLKSLENEETIGFNLVYSGNFKFSVFVDCMETPHILYGINDEEFGYMLKAKENFITPQAVISYSPNGVDEMSQQFHKFIKENIITYKKDKEYKSILFNSWEGAYFKFDTKTICDYAKAAKEIGAELFVLDDGWFGHRDNDHSSLGDWFEYSQKIDLKYVSQYLHNLGMKFGIWFEPEMISMDSNLYKAHPEYTLGIYREKQSICRHQFCLDFSSDEVVENIFQQMCKILDTVKIDYIKWDHNRIILEHKSLFYPKEQQGEIFYRNTLGYYKLFEKLTKRYPEIMFEGCASGGGRFDLGTLYYAPQIWASDNSDPAQRIYIQYATSLGYPLSTIGSHVNNHWIASYKTKALLAMFGTYGFEMNPIKLSVNEIEELKEVSSLYKKYHNEVIENGDLYHIFNPFETNYFALQSVSKDKEKSLFLLINKRQENYKFRYVKLKGLNFQKTYKLSNGENITGEQLMKVGLNLSNYQLNDEFRTLFIVME